LFLLSIPQCTAIPQLQHGFGRREKQRIARAARDEFDARIRLPFIRFKGERQFALFAVNARLRQRIGVGECRRVRLSKRWQFVFGHDALIGRDILRCRSSLRDCGK